MERFFVQKDDVMTFPIENGEALHNLINDEYFSLEEGLSTMIWDSLDGSISVEGIIDMISDQYQMDKSLLTVSSSHPHSFSFILHPSIDIEQSVPIVVSNFNFFKLIHGIVSL